MVIKGIHNKLLGPGGSTQLLHQKLWGRIALTSKIKVCFYSACNTVRVQQNNAENKNAKVDEFSQMTSMVNESYTYNYKDSSINMGIKAFG